MDFSLDVLHTITFQAGNAAIPLRGQLREVYVGCVEDSDVNTFGGFVEELATFTLVFRKWRSKFTHDVSYLSLIFHRLCILSYLK